MQSWAKRGVQAALVTSGLLIVGQGGAAAAAECCPDRPSSPLTGTIPLPHGENATEVTMPLGRVTPAGAAAVGQSTRHVIEPLTTAPSPTDGADDLRPDHDRAPRNESRTNMAMPAADDAALNHFDESQYSQHQEAAEYWRPVADAAALDGLPGGRLFSGLYRALAGDIFAGSPEQPADNSKTTELSLRDVRAALAADPRGQEAGVGVEHSERDSEDVTTSVLPDGSLLTLNGVPTEVIRSALGQAHPETEDRDPLVVWGEQLPDAGELPRIPEISEFVRTSALSKASVLPGMGLLAGLGDATGVALPAAPRARDAGEGTEADPFVDDRPTVEFPSVAATDAAVLPEVGSGELSSVPAPALGQFTKDLDAELSILDPLRSLSWGLLLPTELPEFPEIGQLNSENGLPSLSDLTSVGVALPAVHSEDEVAGRSNILPTNKLGLDGLPDLNVGRPNLQVGQISGAEQLLPASLGSADQPRRTALATAPAGRNNETGVRLPVANTSDLPLRGALDAVQIDALNNMDAVRIPPRTSQAPALSTLDTAVLLRSVTGDEEGSSRLSQS
ncbi:MULTISPECIES: hypothetical protein [Actinoalloteichus]|uniref:Secreted protein n=2 Tax=Actinoalloteichus cyanogriseus TaxID=2893586 RepID=A0ABT1JKH2_ACTCY|nr:hypothetical protein [Actinoalloteichus caeruleus]MCP2333007.1 hypothetical protein [Actinoalloteichus caeruleus DSM 43889]